MIILIETDLGKITLDVSFAAYLGAGQQNSGQNTFIVKEVSKAGLFVALSNIDGKPVIPFGSVDFVKRIAELLNIQLPTPLNIPEVLKPIIGRRIWITKKSELNIFPCFIKPLDDVKLFTGFVVKSKEDLQFIPELKEWDGMLWCSELISEIISEWRCYVHKGEVVNCSCYAGDALAFPDVEVIKSLISAYTDAPAGYALDVGVTGKTTQLIECNDAWGLGYYGGNPSNYFNLVKNRWLEIINEFTR
ncbi:MAG TPA: ATP-grasp domain-containing protein [Chitinophagales bacterium]|nr:ATP-grasp domain-containing protein [Chitinophagales bacterium]